MTWCNQKKAGVFKGDIYSENNLAVTTDGTLQSFRILIVMLFMSTGWYLCSVSVLISWTDLWSMQRGAHKKPLHTDEISAGFAAWPQLVFRHKTDTKLSTILICVVHIINMKLYPLWKYVLGPHTDKMQQWTINNVCKGLNRHLNMQCTFYFWYIWLTLCIYIIT